MKLRYLLLSLCLFSVGCASLPHEGRVDRGIYYAPTGDFSVRIPNAQFSEDLVITDARDSHGSTVSFMIPFGEIHRIDYWPRAQHPLANWAPASGDADSVDGILEAMLNFTSTQTQGLKDLKFTLRHKNTAGVDPASSAAFVMTIESSNISGPVARGYLVFIHEDVVYVLHYAPAPAFSDRVPGERILQALETFRNAISFRPAQ